MEKKALIIYGSIGLGHKVVAENIAAVLKTHPDVQVEMLDVLELYKGRLTDVASRIYEWIIKHTPGIWGFFYTSRLFHLLALPLRLPFASAKLGKIKKYFLKSRPDLVLTTHPNATALISCLKRKKIYQGPLVTTFSDFHFQPFWVFPNVDHYLVMTSEQKAEVAKRGYAETQITITGLPVDPIFSSQVSVSQIYQEYNLSRTKPIILVMGGSRGWGIKLTDVQGLLRCRFEIQIVVVTGKNPDLEKKLKTLAEQHPDVLKIFGEWSVKEVAKLFSVAKILVTKPGGLTLAQALLKKLPMILVNPLPVMEEMNQRYLESRGAAVAAHSSSELKAWVERFLADKKFYHNLRDRESGLAKPGAANLAAEVIIDILKTQD
jgi:processive 1,2-diacylglycerol beta-glucosyltransferase